jgi:acyl-[acyl-carrier-protein] desaturase
MQRITSQHEPATMALVERPSGVPLVVNGPWTHEARERAAAREAHEAFIRYFRKAMKVRNWTPWDDLPLAEIREHGHLLSEDTITIIQAYLGVEDYVGDYVEDGLNLLHNRRERRNLQLAWGMEELKHAEAWHLVLLHSGRRTETELACYREEVLTHKWTMRENHPGMDTPLGVICYAMVQERATYFNYDEMRKRIRAEYGLPEGATAFERQRGQQIGAAGAFKTVATDEIAHHGIFLELTKIYLRYHPHDTLDALLHVFNGFTMPALNLIPDASELAAAMERTLLHTPLKQGRNVNNPILAALGFKNRRALERGVQEAKLLPAGLGPEHVALGRTGEFVVARHPDPGSGPASTLPTPDAPLAWHARTPDRGAAR